MKTAGSTVIKQCSKLSFPPLYLQFANSNFCSSGKVNWKDRLIFFFDRDKSDRKFWVQMKCI